MSKSKVLDLAREVGIENVMKLKGMGKGKDKKPAEAEKAAATSDEKIIERDSEKEIIEKRVKPTVIRRRTRNLEGKTESSAPDAGSAVSAAAATVEPPPFEVMAPAHTVEDSLKPRVVTRKPKPETAPEAAAPVVPAEETRKEAHPIVPEEVRPAQTAVRGEGKKAEGRIEKPESKPPGAVPEGKREMKPPVKGELIGKEETPAQAKKKGFVKKKRLIEERMIKVDQGEEDVDLEKETEVSAKPFRPVKRRVVVKTSRKTEVTVPKPIKRIIRIAEVITVGDFAKRMGVKSGEIIKKLMEMGILVNINQVIDADIASLAASEFGYEVERVSLERQDLLERKEDLPEQLQPRPPVVTIMGHVDHGKTMLLDAIRKTNVVEGEAGGITQHIGAYDVELENGHVVFIDTPGHEAFTAMRARGAQVTDVVVLVVAADDGMMPQTKEAVDHARAAKVPILVAINKIDKPNANPDKVRKELAEYGLVPESWGGSTLIAEVSAKQKTGIKELLELILLQAEILELKVNPDKLARGVIIESKLDKGRGPVATILIQEGTLRPGDVFLAGSHYGKVRAMLNDRGQKIDQARPATPVEVVGFSDVPDAGEIFIAVSDERMAKQISLYRQEKTREKELSKLSKVSLEELYNQIKKGDVKELNVVIKADVQGSIQAIKDALRKLSTEEVKVNILHDSVGGITETDVNLASASNAIIIGFNVRPVPKAQTLAEMEKVDVRTYSVIYDAISDVRKAMEGLLEPTYREHLLGRAEVIQVFTVHKVGTIAGSRVVNGKVVRGSHARLLRDNVVVFEGRIVSLKRFKDDARDCTEGPRVRHWDRELQRY